MTEKKGNVLFVCTGNLCRSPMAEYLFRSRLKSNAPWTASSAGLAASDGLAASQTAVAVMKEMGIDLNPHRSRALTRAMVDEAVIIVTMTGSHAAEIKALFPRARDRIHLLCSFGEGAKKQDIADPLGSGVEVYRRTRDEINECLDGLIDYLQSLQEK